ncbi:MAG: hypothetical protein R8N23_07835 [Reichenbachiella sp.]|uniref:hypothetical protein n=1 Tax=Reichenbachiella sp. TaxID=2184521 RepID=UPI0029675F43|nr:hypothetical protein [Reichenbachiella sp.]MDW3209761.1 hypothetical protein [Reichenbachiella sp.]
MISKWRYVWWPLVMVNWCKTIFRNRLFDLGIWKSVEFEVPVIFVGSIAKDPTIDVSKYIQQLLKGALHIDRYETATYHLEKNTNESGSYHWALNAENTFSTKHKVLGLSEWFQTHGDTSAFVMDGEFKRSEIRPQFRLLITDFNRPFNGDKMSPIGKLKESKDEAKRADAILVYNSMNKEECDKLERSLMPFLEKGTPVFFIKNSFDSLNSFKSSEEIEFISDRPNFERLILNILPNANPDSE